MIISIEPRGTQAPPPWPHQRAAVDFALQRRGTMLAAAMGTGKSRMATDHAEARGARRMLVLCPKSVVPVWPLEMGKYAQRRWMACILDSGTCERKADELTGAVRAAGAEGRPLVVIVNYESAWRSPLARTIGASGFDIVVFDESHRLKAPGGKASRFARELAKRVPVRLALTGTPMPHSPLDVYAQFRAVDPAIFGTSYTAFRARYAVMGDRGGRQVVVGVQNTDEIERLMSRATYKVDADVLNLQEPVHVQRFCELGTAAARVYRDLERDLVADVEGGVVTASNALVRLLRLRQVTGGHVRREDGTDVEIDSAKADTLADVLEDLPEREPVVVFGVFRKDLDQIRRVAEKQGRRVAELSGRVNELREWQQGGADVIAVQLQSGGVGVDLTRARYCIYWSVGYSLGDYMQSLARVQRPGQTRQVCYVHLIAQGTVDQAVYRALESRADVVESVLAGLKARQGAAA